MTLGRTSASGHTFAAISGQDRDPAGGTGAHARGTSPDHERCATMAKNLLPVISPEGGLSRYLREIRDFPMLDAEEEYILAKRWRERDDIESAHTLVTSHLRRTLRLSYRRNALPTPPLEMRSSTDKRTV